MARKIEAVLLVEMDDHLTIAFGAQAVPARQQPLAQLAIVVDLAVEYRQHTAILICDRLVAARDVDNAESSHPERDARLDVRAALVGTAVNDRVCHAAQTRLVELRLDAIAHRYSADTAHTGG